MARKRYKPEEIVAKLRQVDVLVSQGQNMVDAIRPRRHAAAAWPLVAAPIHAAERGHRSHDIVPLGFGRSRPCAIACHASR
jgi:hypothetical protein